MAYLYVTEFARQGRDLRGEISRGIPEQPPTAEQRVTISGTAAASNAFNASTSMVRVAADAACCIEFSADPTATASSMYLAQGQSFTCAVPIGAGYKVSGITL